MLSETSLRYLSDVFNGDIETQYSYKSGPKIIAFFNQYFGYSDKYGQGFPSRWLFTNNKLEEIWNKQQIDKFINIILSKNYLMLDNQIEEVQAAEKSLNIVQMLNNKLKQDRYLIVKKNEKFYLVNEDDDLVLIGGGGFAEVFKRKSTGLIVKKLKDDFITDNGIRSRFKREYSITKSLGNIQGIINVFDYYDNNCSYTMEEAEQTLYKYIVENDLPESSRKICIRQVLNVMKEVHDRDIIHRDISPNNVLLISSELKISDFGLGKDLNMFNSHQTLYTNAFGQYYYCAPEQFMMLKDGDKRSDVYSLGRLINFILTKDPNNNHHFLRTVSEKATSQNPSFRYSDSGELLKFVEKSIKFHEDASNTEERIQKARKGILDEDIENFIFELSGEGLCSEIISSNGFKQTVFEFMKMSDERTMYIVQNIDNNFRDVCKTWTSFDPIADLVDDVLRGEFTFVAKELSARILKYIAKSVNRFNAQRLIEGLLERGIEPLIEEILA